MKSITCAVCGVTTTKRSSAQRYCVACSNVKDLERKRNWAREHGKPPNPETLAAHGVARRNHGSDVSHSLRRSIAWLPNEQINLVWHARVGVPFEYGFSKNAIFRNIPTGHVHLRQESNALRANLVARLSNALRVMKPVERRTWIDILVQKPNHRGDAVNVVDTVCDAVKVATGVDDRWFSIRRLDWEVVKKNPMLYVGVGQDDQVQQRVCSYCGQVLDMDQFGPHKQNRCGKSRVCRSCSRLTERLRSRTRRQAA